jgi:hypothetical protein
MRVGHYRLEVSHDLGFAIGEKRVFYGRLFLCGGVALLFTLPRSICTDTSSQDSFYFRVSPCLARIGDAKSNNGDDWL